MPVDQELKIFLTIRWLVITYFTLLAQTLLQVRLTRQVEIEMLENVANPECLQ